VFIRGSTLPAFPPSLFTAIHLPAPFSLGLPSTLSDGLSTDLRPSISADNIVREFIKRAAWAVLHDNDRPDNEATHAEQETAKRALAFAWCARAIAKVRAINLSALCNQE